MTVTVMMATKLIGEYILRIHHRSGIDHIGTGRIQSYRVKRRCYSDIRCDSRIVVVPAVTLRRDVQHEVYMEMRFAQQYSLGILGYFPVHHHRSLVVW